MKKLMLKLCEPIRCEAGQGMVEYGLVLSLIVTIVFGAVAFLGINVLGILNNAASII